MIFLLNTPWRRETLSLEFGRARASGYFLGSRELTPDLQELARDQATDLMHLVRIEGKGGGCQTPQCFSATGETANMFFATGETANIFHRNYGIRPRPIKLLVPR